MKGSFYLITELTSNNKEEISALVLIEHTYSPNCKNNPVDSIMPY